MSLTAAVIALLYKYTGQQDIIIGTPVAGRQHTDLEDQIGFFVNTLALRTRFSPEDSFEKLLENVKQTTLGAFEHQLYPFGDLVKALQLQRDMSRNPLFDIQVIVGRDGARPPGRAAGPQELTVREYEDTELLTSRFDVVFNFFESGPDLYLNVLYNTDIYSPAYIGRLTGHLLLLMSSFLKHPSLPLVELEYLDQEEKNRLLADFSPGPPEYPKEATIMDLWAAQVAARAEYPAVSCANSVLTYRQLDRQANRLARYLIRDCGVQPGDLVGIMADRSEKVIIAMLAIWKAGAAYVPIDPGAPPARWEFIIGDTDIKALLTQADSIFDLEFYPGPLFALDIQLDSLTTSDDAVETGAHPSGLAYVIYTSGSTGEPKGVLVGHDNLIHSMVPYIKRHPDVKSSFLFFGFSFDGSIHGIWGTSRTGTKANTIRFIFLPRAPRLLRLLRQPGYG